LQQARQCRWQNAGRWGVNADVRLGKADQCHRSSGDCPTWVDIIGRIIVRPALAAIVHR
jgi:hypothetical protein